MQKLPLFITLPILTMTLSNIAAIILFGMNQYELHEMLNQEDAQHAQCVIRKID